MEPSVVTGTLLPSKRLTWGRCTWIVGAALLIGIGLSLWWPLWLMPPHFADTSMIYLAISQLWLLVLIVCALLRPARHGWQTMLKLFMAGWSFSIIPLWLFASLLWFALLSGMSSTDNASISIFVVPLTWLILCVVPLVFVLRRWARPENEPPVARKTLAGCVALGIVITIVYLILINANMVFANGGFFTAPLTCEKPVVTQGQIVYTCRELGSFGSLQTYALEGQQGSPFGQLISHPGNDNLGG